MSDERERGRNTDQAKRWFRRRWLFLAAAAVLCCLAWKAGWWDFRSVDERLAAIDAELAIPDSENAAIYFGRFLADPENAAILDDFSDLSPSAYVEPWADSEHPELAAELEQQEAFMQTLLEIFQIQKARFPVCPGPSDGSWQMSPDMRRLTFVLSWAAANDLAEGRIDAAFSKYRCQFSSLVFYSKGPNGIDEGGFSSRPADDWPIWPLKN